MFNIQRFTTCKSRTTLLTAALLLGRMKQICLYISYNSQNMLAYKNVKSHHNPVCKYDQQKQIKYSQPYNVHT